MKHSASACTTIPAIIIRVILLIPVIRSLPNKFPHAISNAEIGIKNIPTFIEVIALRLAIKRVIKLTQQTTTNGFTLAIQPGFAVSPAIRITYLGIVA